jgi:nitrate/TMAO reductase-like tetraheme cytochrome c subunit
MFPTAVATLLLWMLSAAVPSAVWPQATSSGGRVEYQASATCQGCHGQIFDQHVASQHERSLSNPVFQAQYFAELVPQVPGNPALREEAKLCIACHAPIAYQQGKAPVMRKDEIDPNWAGVTCDFCHTMTGFSGPAPENGNFIGAPATKKLGPFRREEDWHHAYSRFQTQSEACAVCHNAVNHLGLEIKSTYTEWKNSRYAREGIQCQDCHMTTYGFLTGGKPVYASGQAAQMGLAEVPMRARLYTHRFPGAHSRSQVEGAITLSLEVERSAVSPGEAIIVLIRVDNERTGHKMPSGSADLRQMWLSLRMAAGDRVVSVPAGSIRSAVPYDVAGKGPFDQEILGQDIPAGSRLYRSIFVDQSLRQTLSSYNAVRIIFDNRLDAGEIRHETYRVTIPPETKGTVTLQASLNYLAYPSSFAARLGLPKPEPVEVASARAEVPVR